MIINIRGTHGSGKSTVVRQIMDTYPEKEEVRTAIRRRPWGYICKQQGKSNLFVPGHYETPCGGCDTIPVVEDMYAMIKSYAHEGHVLFEGILAQHYALKKFLLLKEFPLLVIVLDTTLEQCISDTRARRDESGKETTDEKFKKLTETIATEHRGVNVKIDKLKAHGIDVRVMTREQAIHLCLELFKGESWKTSSSSSEQQENVIV